MLTGNIGEWSEIYTFLKLLGEGKLYAADERLNKLNDIYYPIISILRKEEQALEYKRNGAVKVIESSTGNVIGEIPFDSFQEHAELLLSKIKSDEPRGRTFGVQEVEDFLDRVRIHKLKANSTKKEDINLIIHDFRTGLEPKLGFSIKSQLGGASTLLNPGNATNFEYELVNKNLSLRESSSGMYDVGDEAIRIRDRIEKLTSEGYEFKFTDTGNETFTLNLGMIDSRLPEILSYVVLYYYSGKAATIKDLVALLEEENPLSFHTDTHKLYAYKIKRLLVGIALGMTPATAWEGDYWASGGYIIVKSDGELVCYHIYNVNEFEDYLFNNTKLDTPSTKRYGFGDVYSDKDSLRLKLNLQIRFVK